MGLDGGRDGFVLALRAGIIAAHHALQLGKLIDHLRNKVGLGEAGRACCQIRIGPDLRGQFSRQRSHTLHLVGNRAELLLEIDGRELFGHLFQRGRAVIVPEKACIIETRRQDTAVALGNRCPAIGRLDIGHDHEVRCKVAGARLPHGEVFLVGAHGQADDLARQVQEGLVHVAQDDNRPFRQPRHLFQQALVLDQLKPALITDHMRLLVDEHAAVLARKDNAALVFKYRLVLLEGGDLERAAAHDTMAFGQVSGFQATDLEVDHIAIEQAEDALQRAHPAQLAAAPAHGFRPVEAANDLRHELCKDVFQRAARDLAQGDVKVSLFRVAAHFGLLDGGQPRPAQEAFNGLVRCTDFRALLLFRHIRRFRRQAGHGHRQAARARQRGDLFDLDAGLFQALDQRVPEVALRLRLHARGNLFGKEFEKKVCHGGSARLVCGLWPDHWASS